MAEAPPEVLTIDELSEYLRISKSSLYKLAQEGKVPGQKVGRHWRFSEADPDHMILERLAAIANVDPARCARIVGILVDGDDEGWRVPSWKDDANGAEDRRCRWR